MNAVYAQQSIVPVCWKSNKTRTALPPHRANGALGHGYPDIHRKKATMQSYDSYVYAIFWNISNISNLSTMPLRVGKGNPGVGA